jgi:hypothetical protein
VPEPTPNVTAVPTAKRTIRPKLTFK